MENRNNNFTEKLLEVTDQQGNKWWIEHNTVILKLIKERYNRKLGILFNERFIVYRTRELHRFNKTNSYGFSSEVIEGLTKYTDTKVIDLYDNYGTYRLSIQDIKDKGEYLFFKEEGFEKQLFVPIAFIESKRIELLEDTNRRNLFGDSWFNQLRAEFHKPYWEVLGKKVAIRRTETKVYPEKEDVFKAFKLTPYEHVKVVVIGQDPYFNGTADGLAFSSKDDMRMPPSLRKIYDAIEKDIKFGLYLEERTNLEHWAKDGVLLLNSILTVDANNPASHHGYGWEIFMGRILEVLRQHNKDLVFMLWGTFARSLRERVENGKHIILEAEHPALAAKENRNWNNNACFSKANKFLEQKGYGEINW